MVLISAYRGYSLYTTNAAYTFVPLESVDHTLTISRNTGEITIGSQHRTPPNDFNLRSQNIFGIVGMISLTITDYIIVMTGREHKGEILGNDIYRATNFQMLPLNPNVAYEHYPSENYLMSLLSKHLIEGMFWFSYSWDMTRRLQAQWNTSDERKHLWESADDRFFWNKYLQTRFIDMAVMDPEQKISPFILPLMYGTFDTRPAMLNGYTLQLCLISRRSRYRAGTRYFRRGVDHEGHVANFNETEQILLLDRPGRATGDHGARLSFVQIRGSVPLYWTEINNLRYKPDLQIMELSDVQSAMRAHLLEQNKIYGDQNLVNLVNHKGYEKPIKEAYEKHIDQLNLPKVKYDYFDYHTECKKMRWDRISLLIERIEDDLLRNGYFYQDADRPDVVKLQLGVVRTNCMDNLDRTNVAQSAIAKWMLTRQLRDIGVFQAHETVESHEDFMYYFRNMWADHANNISVAYSGTGALKTDFTRTGKRTYAGLLEDGVNGMMRYMKNNYFDGPRQDGFDLFTGSWKPRPSSGTANTLWVDSRPLIVRSMPPLASLSLFMICAGLTLPRTSDYSLFYWFVLWTVLLSLALAFICAHGRDYVSWPRLNPLTDIINYEGPGYSSGHRGKGFGFAARSAKAPRAVGMRQNGSGGRWTSQEIELGTMAKKRVD